MSPLRTLALAGLFVSLVAPSLPGQQPASGGTPASGGSAPAPAAEPAASKEPTPEEIEAMKKAYLEKIEALGWTREGSAKLGSMAEVKIPQGWRFTDGNGTRALLKMSGNLPGTSELGMLTTEGNGPWVIFDFKDDGYVKDDEKKSLDADAMLKTQKEGQEMGNVRRREMGLEELHILGWAVPPRFNDQTKNLEWALRIGSANGESINYSTRLLGRHGVMEVDLVCSPEEMNTLLADYQNIISGFSYITGNTYAEYRSGDKVATYGLTGLVAGGAAVAASKMGLFAKLGGLFAKMGKAVIIVIIAVGAGLKALLGKLFGKREQI